MTMDYEKNSQINVMPHAMHFFLIGNKYRTLKYSHLVTVVSFSMFLFVGSCTYTSRPCILCEIPVLFLLFSSAVVTTSNTASQPIEAPSASHYFTSPPLILPQRFASESHYTFQKSYDKHDRASKPNLLFSDSRKAIRAYRITKVNDE